MKKISDAEMNEFVHQAVDRDYKESGKYTNIAYTRGHVFPRQYAADEDQADSTFTFTNVAPQTQHSNGKWAKQVETPMMKDIETKCTPNRTKPAYIVTGVVPGNKWITITRKEKINLKHLTKVLTFPVITGLLSVVTSIRKKDFRRPTSLGKMNQTTRLMN